MKNVYFLLVAIYFLSCGLTAHAQVDLPEGTINALEKYNQSQAEKVNPDSEKEKKAAEQKKAWENYWESKKKEFSELSDYSYSKALNCVFLMVLYLDGYFSLVNRTEEENNCRMKYDLYGLQAIALGASTTFLYCPESMDDLSYDVKRQLWYVDLKSKILDKDKPSVLEQWAKSLKRVASIINGKEFKDYESIFKDHVILESIYLLFGPEYLAPKLVEINQKMEALGCGYY